MEGPEREGFSGTLRQYEVAAKHPLNIVEEIGDGDFGFPRLDIPVRQRGGIFFRFVSRVPDDPIERIDAHPELPCGIFAPPLVGRLRELRELVDQLVAVGAVEGHRATSRRPPPTCRAWRSCKRSSAST